MIRVILLLVLAAAGLVLGPLLADHQGYVLITLGNYTVEMSVVSAVLVAVIFYFALLLLENLLGRLFSLGNRTRGWLSRRRQRKARHQTLDGLVALAEGHYREAERLMIKGARNTETPLINYLTAAEAAQAQGQDEKRDDYLRQAEAEHPKAELAVGLIRARLQLRQGQAAEAEAILSQLRESHPQNLMVQSLLKECYVALGRWSELLDMLPSLHKHKLIGGEELAELQQRGYAAQFAEQGHQLGSEGLLDLWRELPRARRQDPQLLAALCQQLLQLKATEQAESLLQDALRKQLHPALLALCGKLGPGEHASLLALLLRQAKTDPKQAPLLSAIGHLYLQRRQFNEAQSYLEQALALQPNASDYLAMAQVLEQQRLFEKAGHFYRLGLQAPA